MSWTPDEVEEQNREFLDFCEYYARSFPRGEYGVEGNVALAYCGVDNLTFNTAALVGPVASAEELGSSIEQAEAYFRRKNAEWSFILCQAYVPDSVRESVPGLFARHGKEWFWGVTGMIGRKLAPPLRTLPLLEFTPAEDEATWNIVAEINARAYGIQPNWLSEVILNPRLWSERHRGYIGSSGGRPVTTAVIYRGPATVGLYWIATEPDVQGQGYAEAAVRHTLEQARHLWGAERFVLQSTGRGLPLYERIGFEQITGFDYFTNEE